MSGDVPAFVCERLTEEHSTIDFDCGRGSDLSQWLDNRALRYDQENLARTWVLVDPGRPDVVCAYFTLSAHAVQAGDIQKKDKRDDPANGNIAGSLNAHPAQLLGKFAVDRDLQGRNVGPVLMFHVYRRYLAGLEHSAAKYLVLDVNSPELESYYSSKYMFVPSAHRRAGTSTTMYKTTSTIQAEVRRIDEALTSVDAPG